MRVSPRPITEYLLCIPEGIDPKWYFTGIRSVSSDGEVQCIAVHSAKGRLKRQTANYCSQTREAVGILAAPKRFSRPHLHLAQAYYIASKLPNCPAVFFDDGAHTTEYQLKYLL